LLHCTWTISKTDMKRIEAFEMWIWRKTAKISWIAKVSNSEVLNRVKKIAVSSAR